ncbi:MAG: TIGR00730 family Rossman fold protein [Candidatus Babeliales bacterium]|nr:TIGR00730 family Rossman fold protein [Candidatus Babeliales bacterium]
MKANRFIRYLKEYPQLFWEWLKILGLLFIGIWKVLRLPGPRVVFFGGARWHKEDAYFKHAQDLAQKLVEMDISIITGGGPGIMEAGNCGAAQGCKKGEIRSLAIGITGLKPEEPINHCAQDAVSFDSFFVRKWLLINYSSGFVVFPGGFGTLDEMAEVLNLIETYKIKRVPVILFGKEYWSPLVEWLANYALARGLINQQELEIITVTDDMEEVFCILAKHCTINKNEEIDKQKPSKSI